jgi:uncharacterized spore protein YtfJ
VFDAGQEPIDNLEIISMTAKELIESAVAHLRSTATVKTVYGEPVVAEGKTIIPVARVAFGFGGGSGASKTDAENHIPSGAGGGMRAKPVGVVEITPHETKFVAFGLKKRLATAALLGSGIGLGLGFALRRR